MKKIAFLAITTALVFALVFYTAAQVNSSGVTTVDLGVPQPGILPTNPFYFIKEWTRGIRRIFMVDTVKKAEYELKILNEKAAELKRLEEINSDKRAIARALESYSQSTERLKTLLLALPVTSDNTNINILLDNLVKSSILHQELFGELKAKYDALHRNIESIQKRIDETLKKLPETLDKPDTFVKRLERAIASRRESSVKELNALNILERIGSGLPDETQLKILILKDNLVIKFQEKALATSISPADMENFAGDIKEKISVLYETREGVSDTMLRNNLTQVREYLLKESEASIASEDAQEAIHYAEELAAKLEKLLLEKASVPKSAKELLERTNALIEQANSFYATGQFGAAFGQARAAVSSANNALMQLARFSENKQEVISNFKQKFDKLKARALEKGLTRKGDPKIFELFDNTEEIILSLSNLSDDATHSEKFVLLERKTEMLLAAIEASILEKTEGDNTYSFTSPAKPVLPQKMPSSTSQPIRDFEECVKAGNTVMESFPRRCRTKDGQVFEEKTLCIQVIQPARDPISGVCKEFPTPCDVPLGWLQVSSCSDSLEQQSDKSNLESATSLPATSAPAFLKENSSLQNTWTIYIESSGFSPEELKIRKGDKVIWINKDSKTHWPASDIHPTHTLYPGSNIEKCFSPIEAVTIFDACSGIAPSDSYSFVFEHRGQWKYHDHLYPRLRGVIVVE